MTQVKFSKEVVVSRTFTMSAREFVSSHLREVRQFGDELDLLVVSGTDSNFITSAITLKKEDLKGFAGSYSDFDRYSVTEEERAKHMVVAEILIRILEQKFSKMGFENGTRN